MSQFLKIETGSKLRLRVENWNQAGETLPQTLATDLLSYWSWVGVVLGCEIAARLLDN